MNANKFIINELVEKLNHLFIDNKIVFKIKVISETFNQIFFLSDKKEIDLTGEMPKDKLFLFNLFIKKLRTKYKARLFYVEIEKVNNEGKINIYYLNENNELNKILEV